jgi:hypothetical protein
MKALIILVAAGAASLALGCRGHLNDPVGPGWEKLGSRMVNHTVDHDLILAGLQGTFRKIRIDVDGADLEMVDVKVHYMNGQTDDIPIRHHFQQGSWSRVIDLEGGSRIIKSVEFWYRTDGHGKGRANVDVFGLH